ncbi:MAG TPA: TolC family protein [Candidatus Obscuribacterales bacterium]
MRAILKYLLLLGLSAYLVLAMPLTVSAEPTMPMPHPETVTVTALSATDILTRVLSRNPALLASQEALAAARAEQKANEALLWPMLSVNGQYTAGTSQRMSMPVPGVEPANMSMRLEGLSANINLTAMYPLFTGGKFQAQIEGARNRVRQKEAELAAQKLELLAETRQALLTLRWQEARAQLFESELLRQQGEIEFAEQRLALGKLPRYMVLRAHSEAARLQQELNMSHLEMHHQMSEIWRLAALPEDTPLAELPPLALASTLPTLPTPAEAQRLAAERSPRLQALQAQLSEAETRVQLARANYYPFIYLTGTLEQRIPELPEMGSTSGAAVDLLIAMPVFDGWKRDAELERLQHESGSLLNQYTDARNSLQTQTTKLLLEMATLQANLDLSAQLVAQLAEESRIARLRFENGKAIQLELLETINQWRSARLAQLENAYRFESARIQLDQLLALGLEDKLRLEQEESGEISK